MELVYTIFAIITVAFLSILWSFLVVSEYKKQKQRDEWLKSIADDVKFLTTEAVNYEKK